METTVTHLSAEQADRIRTRHHFCPTCGQRREETMDTPALPVTPATPNDSLQFEDLTVGEVYHIVHMGDHQRYARESVMILLDVRDDDVVFSARPVAGTQEMPKDWIRTIRLARADEKIKLNTRSITPSSTVTIRFNTRQYNPPEWEAWRQSGVVAHARDLDLLTERFPNATVVPTNDPRG